MNDFTKDKLEQISFDMTQNILINGKSNCAEEYIQLRDKIESMIDNYCEHEPEYKSESGLIICEGDINKPRRCKKCGEYYE